MEQSPLKFPEVIEREKEALSDRRRQLGSDADSGTDGSGNWFGIALSGGGIRSATINLGFLKTLHKFGILQRADYLSTVSGGGYVGSFVQTTTRAEGSMDGLFSENKIDALRNHGDYWIPGTGLKKRWNTVQVVVGYLVSTLMSFISPAIVFGILYFLYEAVNLMLPDGSLPSLPTIEHWKELVGCGLGLLIGVHLVFNVAFNFDLALSRRFNFVETAVAILGGLFLAAWLVTLVKWGASVTTRGDAIIDWTTSRTGLPEVACWLLFAVGLFAVGLFTNPNAISLHRFYRNQLADCYLQFSKGWENARLTELFPEKDRKPADLLAPYPLINTCLNLQSEKGSDAFKGVKASDYFLLSPLHIGSKLTGYLPTASSFSDYRAMTLPAAVAASAAAVNPGMGIYSNKLLSAFMTVFNVRLGIWVSNPLKAAAKWPPVWWPMYFFRELTATIGSSNRMVNISDGGHIENLAVYELLRRRCRLIVAVDAGEDALYAFPDLENLVIRARNELGIWIKFPDDGSPEELIRPLPSLGYSKKRFAVADLVLLWESEKVQDADGVWYTKSTPIPGGRKFGTLVYVKSSVTAPMMKPSLREDKDKLKYDTYKYKIYHPVFPHESTGDQFFDPVQWEAYYQLGQHIGADVLGLQRSVDAYQFGAVPKVTVEQLVNLFDSKKPLFEETADGQTDSFVREESENESFKIGGKKDAPAPRAAVPPAPPSEEEVGYRM